MNAELSMQVYRDNISSQSYASIIDLRRQKITKLEEELNNTPTNLQGYADVIFGIKALSEVPSVDGPSAGALMALLVISGIEKSALRKDVTIIEQVPEIIEAKEYLESNIGIKVEYVDNINDVLKYAR